MLASNDAARAVERLYTQYADSLCRYLQRHSGEAALSEDLVQECFLRLLSRRDTYPLEQAPAYLHKIARHLLIDHYRRQHVAKLERLSPQRWQALEATVPRPEVHADACRQLTQLKRQLRQLPPLTRKVFLLCRLKGLSYHETAQRLSVSVSTVQKHLSLARRFCRGLVAD